MRVLLLFSLLAPAAQVGVLLWLFQMSRNSGNGLTLFRQDVPIMFDDKVNHKR